MTKPKFDTDNAGEATPQLESLAPLLMTLLTPVVTMIVNQAMAAKKEQEDRFKNRLAYTEQEAAALFGWKRHQMRDLRLSGGIGFSRGPGSRIMYAANDLEAYLNKNHSAPRG